MFLQLLITSILSRDWVSNIHKRKRKPCTTGKENDPKIEVRSAAKLPFENSAKIATEPTRPNKIIQYPSPESDTEALSYFKRTRKISKLFFKLTYNFY